MDKCAHNVPLELPGVRERAVSALLESLSPAKIPIERLWALTRINDALSGMDEADVGAIEQVILCILDGAHVCIDYDHFSHLR